MNYIKIFKEYQNDGNRFKDFDWYMEHYEMNLFDRILFGFVIFGYLLWRGFVGVCKVILCILMPIWIIPYLVIINIVRRKPKKGGN